MLLPAAGILCLLPDTDMLNVEIARRLEDVADLLEAQRANPFRVQASRKAAGGVRHVPRPLKDVFREQGEDGLRAVTGVGERLATALRTLVTTGRLPMLDRLRGEADPVALLESVPGIGHALAERLHDELGIDSLEDLEAEATRRARTSSVGLTIGWFCTTTADGMSGR